MSLGDLSTWFLHIVLAVAAAAAFVEVASELRR